MLPNCCVSKHFDEFVKIESLNLRLLSNRMKKILFSEYVKIDTDTINYKMWNELDSKIRLCFKFFSYGDSMKLSRETVYNNTGPA